MGELDDLIKEMVKDEDNYDKLTRPVCAFITFESDDGYNEALSFSKKGWLSSSVATAEGKEGPQILGRQPEFVAATEPTNIIWENRHIKGANLYFRAVVAVVLISIMLSIAFIFILVAKRYAILNASTFAKLDCKDYTAGLKSAQGLTDEQFDT